MYLTDTMFEEAVEEQPRPALVLRPMIGREPNGNDASEGLDGVLGHAPTRQAPLKDDPLEQLLGQIGPLGPRLM